MLDSLTSSRRVLLVVAGSDSSGGAGVQRDWQALSSDATVRTAITAVTAQSNQEVCAIENISEELVDKQLRVSLSDGNVDAIKVGMLGHSGVVDALANVLSDFETIPLVLDPVLVSTSGTRLLDKAGTERLVHVLAPRASLVTPNLLEAAELLEEPIASTLELLGNQATRLENLLGCPVLLKGGHGGGTSVVDILSEKRVLSSFEVPRRPGEPRGSGCALSSRIALRLAEERSLAEACAMAQQDISWLWD